MRGGDLTFRNPAAVLDEGTVRNMDGLNEYPLIDSNRPGAFLATAMDPITAQQWRTARIRDRDLKTTKVFDSHLATAFNPIASPARKVQIAQLAEAGAYQMAPSQWRAQAYAVDTEGLPLAKTTWLGDDWITTEGWPVEFGKIVKRGCKLLRSHHDKDGKDKLIKQLKNAKIPRNRIPLQRFYIKYVQEL